MESFHKTVSNITEAQLSSLDDADPYSSVWTDAVDRALSSSKKFVEWGGRGRGGRGLSRRTWQPFDIIVPNVHLEYVPDGPSASFNDSMNASQCRTLLQDANIKLLAGKIYGIVGRNGVGKSTLMKRMQACKISGWPIHISCLYISQDTSLHFSEWREKITNNSISKENPSDPTSVYPTPIQLVLHHYQSLKVKEQLAIRQQVQLLEEQIQQLDIGNNPDDAEKLQSFCEQISELEEEWEEGEEGKTIKDEKLEKAIEALLYLAVPEHLHHVSMNRLSPGFVQKVLLACAYFYQPQLLLLDEPTKDCDVVGLVKLRKMIHEFSGDESSTHRRSTVVLVSHDIDLMNDVVTDIIHFHDSKLEYYPNCNYCGFLKLKYDRDISSLRQAHIIDIKRTKMIESIDKMKERSLSGDASSAGAKKLQKVADAKQKKLDKVGIERDPKGHKWHMQKMGTGMKQGSINSVDATSRKKISYGELVKMTGANVARLIDKAIQFKYAHVTIIHFQENRFLIFIFPSTYISFRSCTSTWGGDLIQLVEVGHAYTDKDGLVTSSHMLFDGVDLCIAENSRTFIVGGNGAGKSTLLRILAGVLPPSHGKVRHANKLQVGYFDQKMTDDLLKCDGESVEQSHVVSALSVLIQQFPNMTEQDVRGELTSFGIGPSQATNRLSFLSGGERCRVCLAMMMLKNPDILLLDEVSTHLDVESVEALIYGLKQWNGTIVIVSHDANLIRELGGTCYIVLERQKRVLRLIGGIDAYLRALQVS